jgi:AcrR family transcriptional regulator
MPRPPEADGRSARWEAHRQTRRAELVQAAISAVELHGASVGMDQIAAVAGTSKAVFYRHFSDKADLYRAVGHQMAGVFSDQLSLRMSSQADPRAMVAAGIDTYLALLEKRPELYRFVVRNPVLEQAGSHRRIDYTGIIASRLDDIIRLASPAQDPVDPARRPWGAAIVGFIKSAGDWWLDHPRDLTRAQLTDSLTDLLWNGAAGILAISGRPANERREGA